MTPSISFIVASNNDEILKENFLSSGIFCEDHPHEIIIQKGFKSAAIAYNDGIEKCKNDLMIFTHQDMYFPAGWDNILMDEIHLIEKKDLKWGVLGCFGIDSNGNYHGYVYCNGQQKILGKKDVPQKIRVLDEIVLIFRKSSSLKYDSLLPGFHMYGADICLQSELSSYTNYAISNLSMHNTERILFLPPDFMISMEYIRKTYKNSLPLYTTCFNIYQSRLINILQKSRKDLGIYRRGADNLKSERISNPSSFFKTNFENMK